MIRKFPLAFPPLVTLAAALLLVVPPQAFAAKFEFKQERPATGSYLRRVIGTANVPLDRTYADLDEASARGVRESFPKLGEGDEPPFPARSLRLLVSAVSSVQTRIRGEARVSVVIDVDASGTVVGSSTVESNDEELLSTVLTVLSATKFKPARCGRESCAMAFPFSMDLRGADRF